MDELILGLKTAFLDQTTQSNLAFRPEFLSNNPAAGEKVLSALEQELSNCTEFQISVAFITVGGITPLLQVLKELETKGIPGRILTTDYLSFTDPRALDTLSSLNNISLRIYHCDADAPGFHTKGYIFRNEEIYRIIIGSANMTLSAITTNHEWNTKIVSHENGEIARCVLTEFEQLWTSPHTFEYCDFIDSYRILFQREQIIRQQQELARYERIADIESYTLKPNKMQERFVANVLDMYSNNMDRALLLSSTGTGKTYASAFAMRELHPAKALFVVHREQIAKQAMKSYRKVFGTSKHYGLLSGSHRDLDADFLFSTMQMMAKREIYTQFKKDEFDIIVLDECHHAGSESYQRILNYFTPKFWLGMTASPDTTNYDIYSIFDHNIAYEIRLQQALEEDLLCPFHYFGITDLEINGQVFDDNAGVRNFANLVCDARVDYVIEKANYYGYSGERVKGVIFCSRKDEARELSLKFNQRGYRSVVLTGEDSQEERESAIERLATETDPSKQLDYIFTVDIFNEGVDIPEINQVIMLRPTQSPVVFIQQLGRGLRKQDGKEFVVILDFIGNYMNNFMIPIALSGDRSYNKDTMRRYVREGSRIIPGSSTIHFDEISKRRIYSSIDSARTNDMSLLRESYRALKYKLGRIPTIAEFGIYGSIDVTKLFDKCGSYHAFLKKAEPEYTSELNIVEEQIIEFLSKKLSMFKRVVDQELLKQLIETGSYSFDDFRYLMFQKYGAIISRKMEDSIFWNLTNEFPKEFDRNKYRDCVFIKRSGNLYSLSDQFAEQLEHISFKKMVLEILDYAISRTNEQFSKRYLDTSFQLYQKYTYEDVCRLLNFQKNMNAQNIGGYFYDAYTKTLPVFINYDKAEDAIAYEDRFINEGHLIALSKHPRKTDSSDADHIYKRKEEDHLNRIFLFIRKNKDDNEAKEFYFLGEMTADGKPKQIYMESTKDSAFEIHYILETPVRSDIYDYIVRD